MKKAALFLATVTLIATMSACGANVSASPDTPEETEASSPVTETEAQTPAGFDEDVDISENTMPRGGTNQNDAVLLPMNTKLRGTVSDGQGLWYAFTTGNDADATYRIRLVNKNTSSGYALAIFIYDELGTEIAKSKAWYDGIASALNVEELLPNTTYYVRVSGVFETSWDTAGGTYDYMMLIENPNEQMTAYNTSDTLAEAMKTDMALTEVHPGTNQDEAAFIPVNVKISGTASDALGQWYAFTTGPDQCDYQFITVNENTSSGYALATFVYDELGTEIAKNKAGHDGIASVLNVEELLPNTTYYVRMIGVTSVSWYTAGGTYGYTLVIRPAEEAAANTATVEQLEEDLVFETPFELNSTQVMFVANKAVFIDESAAKAALAPVAEVILAHPDHPILLAGTTATDGTQASCVDLSNRRAAAVKDLLVNAFGVPESQIQTVGLGYEADPFVRGKDRDANGKFVESEGAKNRRVVVLDIEDPIAKELLGQ